MDRQNSFPSSPTVPNGDDASLELRRKIAMLKKALVKEKEDKQKEFEELESLKKKLSLLELSLNEKDTQIEISNKEREKLENKLKDLLEKSDKPVTEIGASVSALEIQNKTLLEEFNVLQKKNSELKSKFESLNAQNTEIQNQLNLKDKHLQTVIDELTAQLSELKREEDQSLRELNNVKDSFSTLSDSYNKLTNEYFETEAHQKTLEEEIISFTKELQAKQLQLIRLNERLLKQSENEAILSDKLMQYKNELVEAESYYQKHEVTKINNSLNNPATLILKHDHTGEYVLEIEERNDKITYGISSIECIARHPHNDKKFFIRLGQGYTIEFESNECEGIVNKMNFFMDNAKNDR